MTAQQIAYNSDHWLN